MSKRLSFVGNLGITLIDGLSNVDYSGTIRTNVINIGAGFKFTLGRTKV